MHYYLIYFVAVNLLLPYFEVIGSVYAPVSYIDVPDTNLSPRVSHKQPSFFTESDTVWVDVIEHSLLGLLESGVGFATDNHIPSLFVWVDN